MPPCPVLSHPTPSHPNHSGADNFLLVPHTGPRPRSVPRGSWGSAGQDFCGNPQGLAGTPTATGPGNSCRWVLQWSRGWLCVLGVTQGLALPFGVTQGLSLRFEGTQGLALPFGVTQGAGPVFWGHTGPAFAFRGDARGCPRHLGTHKGCPCARAAFAGCRDSLCIWGHKGWLRLRRGRWGWLWGHKSCIFTWQTRRWL